MMGVYIKGMEMPTRCEDCFCYRHNAEYDYAYCNISSVNVLGHGNARLNNCPLVFVPPHGDLIDRKPFVEFIKTHWDSYDQWFVDQLEARPTVITADTAEEGE